MIVAGGDGTVSLAASCLAGSDTALGIIPTGSGNDFARNLGLPLDADQAADVVESGQPKPIDLGVIEVREERRLFANMATAGNTGMYLDELDSDTKARWGPFCYMRGVVDLLRDLKPFQLTIEWDEGEPISGDFLNVFVANGQGSGGGMTVSPDAKMDDGLFDVVLVRDGMPGEIAGLTAEYLMQTFMEHELIEFRRCRSLSIESDPSMSITADGELVGEAPARFEVLPGALRVISP
ncbi:Diacylglycerol kinase [Stratiformator vulcanicus]|uniref:Diacylglycerol kinase n=1 Tax=Stratiformator vulcanicus TaxID=2527980 RepID=A0A517R1P2_9PLAN|nr:Diacylglycerol kinase [Stratiformator vulcanicus]